MRKKKPYENQLNKIIRKKQQVEDILNDYKNGIYSKNIDELYDEVMTFFIFCHHIKDYIKNDSSLNIDKKVVENNVSSNSCLKICADICNGTKHLKLDNSRIGDGEFVMNIKSERDKDTGDLNVELSMKSKTIKENFSKLANDCIIAWEDFIKKEITNKPKNQIKIKCPTCKEYFMCDDDLIICDCPKCGQERIITGIR